MENIIKEKEKELKPCPFCGRQPKIRNIFYGDSNYGSGSKLEIYCDECETSMKGEDTSWQSLENCKDKIDRLIEKWNRRR